MVISISEVACHLAIGPKLTNNYFEALFTKNLVHGIILRGSIPRHEADGYATMDMTYHFNSSKQDTHLKTFLALSVLIYLLKLTYYGFRQVACSLQGKTRSWSADTVMSDNYHNTLDYTNFMETHASNVERSDTILRFSNNIC